jgi:hypothetical protein
VYSDILGISIVNKNSKKRKSEMKQLKNVSEAKDATQDY